MKWARRRYLQGHQLVIHFHLFCQKVCANCSFVLCGELFVDKLRCRERNSQTSIRQRAHPIHKAGLADSARCQVDGKATRALYPESPKRMTLSSVRRAIGSNRKLIAAASGGKQSTSAWAKKSKFPRQNCYPPYTVASWSRARALGAALV